MTLTITVWMVVLVVQTLAVVYGLFVVIGNAGYESGMLKFALGVWFAWVAPVLIVALT